MKILVAEDDNVSRLVLVTKLKKLGHHVIATENGAEAWGVFHNDPVNVVITDWMMPQVDGIELCRRIREIVRDQYTYVIMLTALAGKKNYLEGMNAGADDFLTKPVDTDELSARLHVAERILTLQKEVKQLEGLLPICAYCKSIRDEKNEWHQLEHYISDRTEAQFSHGYCPSCIEKHVKPQLDELARKRVRLASTS